MHLPHWMWDTGVFSGCACAACTQDEALESFYLHHPPPSLFCSHRPSYVHSCRAAVFHPKNSLGHGTRGFAGGNHINKNLSSLKQSSYCCCSKIFRAAKHCLLCVTTRCLSGGAGGSVAPHILDMVVTAASAHWPEGITGRAEE